MPYDPQKHHRRSIRLKGYNYTRPGMYFVTICVQNRECLFGNVVGGEMRLNDWGQAVMAVWEELDRHFPRLTLDASIVMPNHMHGILMLGGAAGRRTGEASAIQTPYNSETPGADASPLPNGTQPGSLAAIVQNFKSVSARRINALRGTPGARLWQRNYWEHIIRDEADLARIREYIHNNPLRWAEDGLHPAAPPFPGESS